ncbi:hypothetical protein [Mesorhizobium sp. WSM3882]|uniref:hypothetical protein n=1 Tax=Mesorhizobium sp. WSM3882 TaxID=2029407 RepID=UPI001FD8BF6E|nr:hypothetical protein [Mesorhizobium sp. WSM3882]
MSREIDPHTGIEGSGAYNVMAAEARLKGKIRSGHESTCQQACRRLRQVVEGLASSHNATPECGPQTS